MRKRILVITNECYRSYSANGYCMENIINNLALDCLVDIVSFDKSNGVLFVSNSVTAYYVRNSLFKKKGLVFSLIQRVINKFFYEFVCPDLNYIYRRRAMKSAIRLLQSNKYDLIVAGSGGYTAQIIAKQCAMNSSVDFISVFFDPPVPYNVVFNRRKIYYKKFCFIDLDVQKRSKAILLDEAIYNAMNISPSNVKYYKVGIPLMVKRHIGFDNVVPQSIAFIGTLYEDIRNPGYSIELLSSLSGIGIDFYGNKLTAIVLEKYQREGFRYCGEIPHKDVGSVVERYHYLLNISNDNTSQIPSKLIEYVSYRKPIINVVKTRKDPTVAFIERYGYGINIIESEKDNLERLRAFLYSDETPIPDYNDLFNTFKMYTPEFSSTIIKKLID